MSEDKSKMNTLTSEEAASSYALNESSTAVGIETQSVLEANESESNCELPASSSNEFGSLQLLEPSTLGDFDSGEVSLDSIDNSGDEGIGDIMDEPEGSSTLNREVPIPPPRPSMSSALERFQSINLQPKIKVAVADEMMLPEEVKAELEEENSADTLSPLMMDNHVYIEHCEMLKNAALNVHDDSFEDENFEVEMGGSESHDEIISTTKRTSDSLSSTDSEVYEIKKTESASKNEQNSRQIDQYDYRNMSSDENNKDSGCDGINKSGSDDDQPIEIPDDEFCEKIVEQVEFYFSDESLLKDAFLLKHVRRNKEGFVSLKLVSSFKRVRALVKDWRVVGVAIKRKSKKIELNDIETKIRRVESLPLYDETTPSRTVVATNLPFDKLTIEKVSDIFSKCGEIALVRILRPNCPIPADVRQFVNKHPELQQNECALVEFVESASARRAQQMDDLIVFELVLPKKKTGKKATNVTKMIESYKYNSESENERSRGGENIINNNRFHLKRNISGPNFARPECQAGYQYSTSPRKMSLGNENANVYTPPFNSFQPQQQYYEIPPRRMSNVCSPIPIMNDRKYSNCSDGYSSCSDVLSRRQSVGSDLQRRLSNCSDMQGPSSPQSRRSSMTCSDHCSCGSRRISQYSNDSYRRMSNGSVSDFPRKFSNGSAGFVERKYSSASTSNQPDARRISFDTGYDRKISSGSLNYERKYSNGFDPLRKLSQTSDHYINGRKISTDSGYDRRMSINSITYDNENPIMRSRGNSLVCPNHPSNEPLIRKPLGPDPEGGKGFASRTRKFGVAVTPSVISS